MDYSETRNFSIIIPVFNAEKTICRCLDSIMVQTNPSFEVLLIDDCSTDQSREIISNYVEKDKRFRMFFNDRNSGPSAARNYALKIAQGDFIVFVDSDDYVLPEWLETIEEKFNNTNSDIVYFEYFRQENGKELRRFSLPIYQNKFPLNLISLTNCDMFGYTWIKAIRRCIITGIYFDESLRLFEDEVFTCELISKRQPRISYCNKPLYVYVKDNQHSLSTVVNLDYPLCCDKVFLSWANLLEDTVETTILKKKANHMFENCKWYGLEKQVNPLRFWRNLSKCEFIKYVEGKGYFNKSVKNYNLFKLILFWIYYKIKIKVSGLKRAVMQYERKE